MLRSLIGLVTLVCIVSASRAGEFNKVLKIGDAAPDWKDLPGTDGRKHSLADFKEKKILIITFTCNSCPYAIKYEPMIARYAQQIADTDVGLVAINVNTIKEDALPEMKLRAEKKKYKFPYLYDESQKVAKDYGATTTPEFFVLNKDRKVVYMGAWDEKTDVKPGEENKRYLQLAVDSALSGTPATPSETNPRGCKIRFNRAKD